MSLVATHDEKLGERIQRRDPWMTSGSNDGRPAGSAALRLLMEIEQRTACVGVIGLGYVGLPLAGIYHDRGFRVLGFDIDPRKVETQNAGKSYIGHIPDERVEDLISDDRFESTSDFSRISEVKA